MMDSILWYLVIYCLPSMAVMAWLLRKGMI